MVEEVGVEERPSEEGAEADEVAFWARVKADYDNRELTVPAICAKHGVSTGRLARRMERDGWQRRSTRRVVDRRQIIARMFRVLEKQARDLELEMEDMERTGRRSGAKDVAVLGKMAANFDRLIALDAKHTNKARATRRSKQMREMRTKLVERIERLKRP